MSADQLSRISPDHSVIFCSVSKGNCHVMINEKFVNFVPKPIIFKQNLYVEGCVGVLMSKAEGRGIEQVYHLSITCSDSGFLLHWRAGGRPPKRLLHPPKGVFP